MEVVPFEIAKKLKEKGFREKCFAFYYKQGGFQWNCMRADTGLVNVSWACLNYNNIVNGDKINAPTISQVLKWLREELKIHIQVLFACPPNRWEYITIRTTNCEIRGMQASFISYELAAIAGIEYVIDNLI